MKTTKKQFAVFIEEAQSWLSFFNLNDWATFFHLGDVGDVYAGECQWIGEQHQCYIGLNDEHDGDDDYRDERLKQYAFHEVCHLLFAGIHDLATNRFTTEEQIDQEIHRLIRLFENIILANADKLPKPRVT